MKKNKFCIWGLWEPLGAGRAQTNATRIIFRLVTSENMSNRSIKVVIGALNDEFEVGALPRQKSLTRQSKIAHKASPVSYKA